MNLDFSPEQNMLRRSVAEFLAKECPFDTVKEIEESKNGYLPSLWKKMADLGWMEVCFPKEFGGCGDSFMDIVIIMEEMGKAAFPSPFFSTVVQCGLTILEGGSEHQKKDLLPEISKGKLLIAMALYEEDAGYFESCIQMPAEETGDGYVINGTKLFVSDANIADKLIVVSRLKNIGITLFVVDAGFPGITYRKMPNIAMENCCEVVFENVLVSKNDIIGEIGKGWDILEKMFTKATIAKCAEMVGGCKQVIDMTADYAKKRVQYGKPIGGFQAIQHYMADMLLGYETTSNYLYKVCWYAENGANFEKDIHALKIKANEQYKFISERGVQIHGGVGTTREFNVGLFYRRAKAYEFVMGDSDYHIEKLADELIKL